MKMLLAATFAAALLVSGAAIAETLHGEIDQGQVAAGTPINGAAAPNAGYHAEIGDIALFTPGALDAETATVDLGGAAGFGAGQAAAITVGGDAASGTDRVLR